MGLASCRPGGHTGGSDASRPAAQLLPKACQRDPPVPIGSGQGQQLACGNAISCWLATCPRIVVQLFLASAAAVAATRIASTGTKRPAYRAAVHSGPDPWRCCFSAQGRVVAIDR